MMVKDRYIHKFYAFAMAAVFALTLAGCGGGGGTAATPEEPPVVEPMPEPPAEPTPEEIAAQEEADALAAAQEAAMAAYMMAVGYDDMGVDPVASDNAKMYASMAMAASASAAEAETSEMAMEYQVAAEMYRDMAMEAAMTRSLAITKAANDAANKTAINTAELRGVTAPAPVSNAGRVGAAVGTAADTVPTTGGSGVGAAEHTLNTIRQGSEGVSVTARYTAAGPRFTIAAGGAATAESNTLGTTLSDDTLQRGENPVAIMTRGSWGGAELVRTDPGDATGSSDDVKEYAIAFSDIKANTPTYSSSGTNFIDTAAFEAATENLYVNRALVTGDNPGDGSHFVGTINVNPADNDPPVSGRFHCPSTTSSCSISVNSAGVLVGISGYQFRPVDPTSPGSPDSDYLAWGLWLEIPVAQPAAGDADTAAGVTAFASGNDPFTVKQALSGTATYNGVATGLYSAGGMVEYFDADASLTANFGDHRGGVDSGAVPGTPNTFLLGAVTGMISNIKAGGIDVDGSITLGRAPILDDGTATDDGLSSSGFKGMTGGSLGGTVMAGDWGGQFYGKDTAQGVAARSQFPTTAAGTFGAKSVVGPSVSVLGSFGTWKAE